MSTSVLDAGGEVDDEDILRVRDLHNHLLA